MPGRRRLHQSDDHAAGAGALCPVRPARFLGLFLGEWPPAGGHRRLWSFVNGYAELAARSHCLVAAALGARDHDMDDALLLLSPAVHRLGRWLPLRSTLAVD